MFWFISDTEFMGFSLILKLFSLVLTYESHIFDTRNYFESLVRQDFYVFAYVDVKYG